MSRKSKRVPRVPAGNQTKFGPQTQRGKLVESAPTAKKGAPADEQDPKRRLGNYEQAGEHSFQQPGGKNDANRFE